jgi:hypothetical protein
LSAPAAVRAMWCMHARPGRNGQVRVAQRPVPRPAASRHPLRPPPGVRPVCGTRWARAAPAAGNAGCPGPGRVPPQRRDWTAGGWRTARQGPRSSPANITLIFRCAGLALLRASGGPGCACPGRWPRHRPGRSRHRPARQGKCARLRPGWPPAQGQVHGRPARRGLSSPAASPHPECLCALLRNGRASCSPRPWQGRGRMHLSPGPRLTFPQPG